MIDHGDLLKKLTGAALDYSQWDKRLGFKATTAIREQAEEITRLRTVIAEQGAVMARKDDARLHK